MVLKVCDNILSISIVTNKKVTRAKMDIEPSNSTLVVLWRT